MVLESNTLDVLFVKDGQQGEDGKVLYTWIKYAKDANGTGMTDDPNGAVYIGISYNNESSTESNDPTQYAWTKIQGADGKKGEDAYTIFLENENISFATDKNRNPLSEQAYTSGITIMKGAKPVTDFTIGDMAKTQGIAVAKTDTAIAISVVNGNPLPSDSGEIVIPISVGGTVFKKVLTWTCAKKGDQGEKGEQGIQGPQGEQGIAGKDGTSVTIINKSITYQLSTSGTTIPTGTWQTSPQTIPEGQYQWTKTSVTYSDGNKTESYSISYHGKNGSDGTSVKTTSTSVKYQVGDSGTTKPTGTWQSNVPTVAQGKYLWTQTIVNYSDGNSTESYSVSYRGIDGSNGVNGMNAATVYLYQRATSTPNKPSNTLTYTFSTTKITGTLNNGWSTAIPTGTDAVYVTVASVSSKNDTATIATSAWSAPVVLAQNGKTGSDGKAGLNVATIYLYQRNTSKPSKPSASVTYTFSTGVASGLNNGWSQKIPDGTNPLYVTLATASSNTATDTILSSEWSDVVVMAQNGEDGISPKVSLSKSGNTTTISIIDATGTHTQTVKDGTNGTPGAAGKDGKTSYFHVKYSNDGGKTFTSNSGEDTGIYMGSYTDYTETDSTDVKKYNWVKVKGDKGDTGQKGDNAKNLSITPSSQYFKSTDGGKTFAPNTITIKPTIQGEISFGKWQYSIDGGVSFADVVSGQKGLTVSNNVLTVSKDSSLYSDAVTMVTFRAVANDSGFYDTCSIAKLYDVSDIGDGRNLLWNSNFAKTDEAITGTTNSWGLLTRGTNLVASIDTSTKHNGFNTLKTVSAANGDKDSSNDLAWFAWGISERTSDNLHSKNQNYTLSFYAKASVTTDFIVRWGYDAYGADTTRTLTTNWQKYEIKLHQATSAYSITIIFKLLTAGTVWFSEFKLEKGSSATGYSTAPEDLQTAILSTKSEISDVSLEVDNNKQAIEQRVEKTTYQQDLKLVKGDISKANEGLNKWRYEIYPKSLFDSTDQGKSTIDIFAKNKNLTPSRTVLFNDTDLSIQWNSAENYIGYALTFTKFSAAKSVAITFAHDDGAHIYLNGKLIGGSDAYSQTGESLTLGFVKGWNCIEVVVNEGASTEGFKLGTTISAISECQLMNCYYGTPVARQSHITNQLVQNTTDIKGISTKVSKVTSVIGDNGENFTSFKNDYSDFKQTMNGFKTTVGQTYVTKDDFNGLEIGGRNLLTKDDCNMSKWTNTMASWINVTNNEYNNIISYTTLGGGWEIVYKKISVTKGQKYILSFDYKVNKAYNYLSGQKYGVYLSTSVPTNAAPTNIITNGQYVIENTVTNIKRGMITFTATVDTLYIVINGGCINDNQTGLSFEFNKWKLEKGNKATDWTPAPEDDEINGQNLVSNLPSNWEQGTVTEGSAIGTTYANTKSSSAGSIRPKELIPVSGDITISIAYSNQSKKPVRHWIAAYDVNKNYLGNNYVSNAWNSFPRTLNMKDAKYIAIMVSYTDSSAITPSDISQICLKIERGTSATPFTLAPEDVNGKIVNVETIANQTADKFSWIVKSGTSSSNFEITDRLMNLVSASINLDGIVSFMNTAKGDGRKNLYNLDYSSFENVASQKDAICYAKDNGVTSVSIDSSVSYDGNKSLKISYTTANLNSSTTPLYLGSSANNYGCVKIQAGKQYILSCYVKSDSTTGLFMIDIQGHDTPDTKTDGLYLSNIDPRKLPGSSTGVNLSTDWQRAVCAIKVADNATGLYWSVVPLIWGRPSSSSAPQTFNVWVDCIMLEEVDSISNEPGTYIFDKETIIDGGSIKTDTITGNQILAGSITADKIATDAIKSRNYISSGGTKGSFLNLSDGSFTSPNLSWDSNGNLIAKNANLSGEITATKGTIGKYEITDQWLTTGSGSTCTGIGGNQAFWAGAEDSNSAPFRVGYDGKLTSSNADITGTITATNGKIGRYDITSTYLMTNSGSNASGIGGNQAFWAGAEDSNSAPFRVGYDGVLWAENAAIRGSIETGNLGDEGDTVSIINGHIGIRGTSNNVEIYSTGFKFGIDGDYYLESVSEGVKCYRNLYATDFIADGWIYNASGGHYTWKDRDDAYISCGDYNGHNVYYYANYHAFYVNKDSGQGMMYINTNGVTSRVGFTKTSDERIKKNFESFDDNIIDSYMNIEPVKYQLKQSSNDNYHFGFKAQHVDKVFSDYGDTYNESFDICTSRPIDPDKAKELYGVDDMTEEYGLRYDELIAPTTYMVQHIYKELESTKGELAKVKQEKADLEARLQAIEVKLGL